MGALPQKPLKAGAGAAHQKAPPLKAGAGASISGVKVHGAGGGAKGQSAKAFTGGSGIAGAGGAGGDKLIPHEAAHVVQQRQGRVRPSGQM